MRKNPSDHFRMTTLSFDKFFQFCKEIGDGNLQIELKRVRRKILKQINDMKTKCKFCEGDFKVNS